MTKDLVMAFRDSNDPKKKASKDKKCFNYHKFGHLGCDYYHQLIKDK